MEYYFGTNSFLSWCLNHYFFNRVHYLWVAKKWYPIEYPNPKSSNPLLIYQDFFHPWKSKDNYDKYVTQHRIDLRKGVMAQTHLSLNDQTDLKTVCDKAELDFFHPVVYRVEITSLGSRLDTTRGSAAMGSKEGLVSDLSDGEFEILMLDDISPDFQVDVGTKVANKQDSGDADINDLKRRNCTSAKTILLKRLLP